MTSQAVQLVLAAAGADFLAAGEVELLPPHLDQVIRAPADAAPIQALEQLAIPRQRVELDLGQWRPDLVASLQVVEPVMRRVMADLPQAERSHRRQERDPSADGIQPLAAGETAVAGVVTDHEQAHDAGRHDQCADQLQRYAGGEQHDGGAGAEKRQVGPEYREGVKRPQRLVEGTEQCFPGPVGRVHAVVRLPFPAVTSADSARGDTAMRSILGSHVGTRAAISPLQRHAMRQRRTRHYKLSCINGLAVRPGPGLTCSEPTGQPVVRVGQLREGLAAPRPRR